MDVGADGADGADASIGTLRQLLELVRFNKLDNCAFCNTGVVSPALSFLPVLVGRDSVVAHDSSDLFRSNHLCRNAIASSIVM